MPYLGNQHNVGDHVNNFKVLDDISSHTATFDGSATSVVDTTNNTIRVPLHRFIQGQRVTYTNGGGGNIGGLTTGTAYFVSFDSANTIKLATTLANANSNTVINLSAVGSGTSHTLNAAFDGVNTKFKMTHGSGKAARLNNATQINVAINNVIQRPNLDPNNFTDGFALQDNHKIVFKTAPTVNDIFWGSIIANTIENFDLRDNEVDNFTGDGSTTEFTLSTIPANNESVIVSINGVVQHPSDKNTARSYTLIDSILQFTAAPALGDGIQVRHIGFAGASTNDVSGFYGRTGNVALISSDHITTGDITSRNINSSGIITATTFDGAFSSSVGGSNANFTGIVTSGVFKGGDIEGRNLKITGLSTFVGDASFSGNVSIGGTLTYEDVTNIDSVGIITAQSDVHVGAGLSVVGVSTFSGITTVAGNTLFAKQLNVSGVSTFTGAIDANGDLDVDGHTNLDNVNIAGITTFANNVHAANVFTSYLSSSSALVAPYADIDDYVDVGSNIKLGNAGIITATTFKGDGDFVELDVDGHTNLDNVNISGVTTSGNIHILSSGPRITFSDTNENPDFYIEVNATQFLIQDASANAQRFRIQSNGIVDINGNTNFSGGIDVTGGPITATGDLDVDGHTNLDNVSIAGIVTVTGDLSVTDDIIAGDEIRNNVATDFWASDNTFINLNGFGNLTHMGGFETNLTSNGYRDTNGQWVSYNTNSEDGAAQIGLKPQGSIVFRTDASKANGTAHNPSTRLTIDDEGVRPQGGVLNLRNSSSTGNITANLLGVSGDSRIDLENTGDGNYSGIDFVRERSSGTGVVGGSIFMKSDTSSNNAHLYLQAQSASAQSPVTTALSDNNGVRLILKGGEGVFSVESGASERLRITSAGVVEIDQGTAGGNHFKITNDEIVLLAGAYGTGDTYAREAFLGSTRVDSGTYPPLRLAGQGGIKLCVDANSERLIINTSGDYLFLGGTLRIKDGNNSAQRGAIYGDSTSFHVNAGGTLKLYAGGGERLTVANSGGHKITCNESYYAANLSECNSGLLALNINQTRSSQTKGIALGAIGNGGQRTGIQCYDTSNNSANTLLLNPHGGKVAINITGEPSAQFEVANDSTTGQLYEKHSWAGRRFFALPIINNETRWYKIMNYAAGNMLVGSLQIYTTRQGGFNQTKGYNEWKVSWVGYTSGGTGTIYGTAAENSSFYAGTAASVDLVKGDEGGTDENIYIKIPGSIYGGYVYMIFEGITNNWQLDDSSYLTSAP